MSDNMDDIAIIALAAAGVYVLYNLRTVPKAIKNAATNAGLGTASDTNQRAVENRKDAVISKYDSSVVRIQEGGTSWGLSNDEIKDLSAYEKKQYISGVPVSQLVVESAGKRIVFDQITNAFNPIGMAVAQYRNIKELWGYFK